MGSFLLALLSKTSVVMLPFVMLGCAWWRRGRIEKKDMLRTVPFFCLAVAFGLLTVWFQYQRAIAGAAIRTDGFLSRLAVAGCAVWFYLYKATFPYELAFVYPRWQIDPWSILSYMPLFTLLVCLAAVVWYRRSWGRHTENTVAATIFAVLPCSTSLSFRTSSTAAFRLAAIC